MAFPATPGWGNLPRGNWSPTIFSQKVIKFFRTNAVAEAITNTDFAGDINQPGDTVKIIKEPVVTVSDYKRGGEAPTQDIDDDVITLTVDQAKQFRFKVEDIEAAMSHINWEDTAMAAATFALTDAFDIDVLQNMHDNATTNSALGSAGSPKSVGFGSGNDFLPLDLVNKMALLLNENNIPRDGRWFAASPAFFEQIGREDSKLIDVSLVGGSESLVINPNIGTTRKLHGFDMFMTNNNPLSSSGDITVMAGHKSSFATATALTKSESFRDHATFADIFRGLLVFGRKLIRPEALFTGFVTYGDV